MMKKHNMLKLLVVALASILLLAGCAGRPRLRDVETYPYSNQAGYRLLLPVDWQLTEEDTDTAAFAAPEGEAGLTIVSELGGEAYYGLDEITQMLLDNLPDDGPAWQAGRVVTDKEEQRRQVFTGEDEAGATVYLDITVLQPYPGIRYYLLFAAGNAAYSRQSALFGEIAASFELEQPLQYLYALMEERRTGAEKGL